LQNTTFENAIVTGNIQCAAPQNLDAHDGIVFSTVQEAPTLNDFGQPEGFTQVPVDYILANCDK
jgi:hypothetical protein